VLPVAFCCFTYEEIRKSQNSIEYGLVAMVAASLPFGCKPLFVMDRGYGRAAMFLELKKLGIPYLIRVKKKVGVTVDGKKKLVGKLYRRRSKPRRYTNILYHGDKKEPVDLVVFHDPQFKEPWYLVVPPNSEGLLPTEEVIDLYSARMHIELTFRDWKTHLGLRGLRLETDMAMRLSRLLLTLTAAYILAVLMGAVTAAKKVRRLYEILRRTPRH
jgi:IS4 transposase